jgi:hypothetical protein
MSKAKYIKAYYTDDEDLLKGVKTLKAEGVEILDVLSPFPVHGLDKILGYRRSWIARVGFIGGAIGALSGFGFQTWVFTKDYPLNIGGKPFFAVPSFIPVTFELTVLFAAFSMVFAFLLRSKIGPGKQAMIHDEKITDDRFVVLVGLKNDGSDANIKAMKETLSRAGALGITLKDDVELSKNY